MTTLLEKPAKKFFLVDLCQCSEIPQELPSAGGSNKKEWLTSCAGIKVRFSVVFVQGIVVETRDNANVLYIDDGTSLGVISGCNNLPFTTTKPSKGHYVMVIGHLVTSGKIPSIRPTKIQNLSKNVSLSVVWPIEVIDILQQTGIAVET